ncbi:glycosyltransferase [Gammaproteobacteria bacterium]|nr:glycosyltransferase [Gammaproteobacteria bacterium]|tara:strand:- start:1018 stop:2247 length:1230 start_codon:yes stop_codon:yes gene_type:complete
MIIVHLSSASFDSGAGIAVLNLHKSMLAKGVDSRLYSPYSVNENISKSVFSYPNMSVRFMAKFTYWFDRFLIRLLGYRGSSPFSLLRRGKTWPSYSDLQHADIIHLHWVGNSFMNLQNLEGLKAKFVWTLRDWWPLTGGSHIPEEFEQIIENRETYPFIPRHFLTNLMSREQFKKTSFLRRTSKVKTIAQSDFMRKDAEQILGLLSGSVGVIPSSINDAVYKYQKKILARDKLGLSIEDSVIAIGATNINDSHKGLDILSQIPENSKLKQSIFLVFGNGEVALPKGVLRREFGFVDSESMMCDIYAASDILLCPSLYESFGKVALESIACGTPVIAFSGTGPAEIIERTGGGRVSLLKDTTSFFREAEIQINDLTEEFRSTIAHSANEKYSSERVALEHIRLYSNLLLD